MAADQAADLSAASGAVEDMAGEATAACQVMALLRLPRRASGVVVMAEKALTATRAAASTGTGASGKVPATVVAAALSGLPVGRAGSHDHIAIAIKQSTFQPESTG